MTFADTKNSRTENRSRRKINFVDLPQGTHIIRILDDSAKKFDTHWLNGISVACIGEGCPICENNRRLMSEFSDDKAYRNAKDWNPARRAFFVNVFEKTPAKVCPNCQKEVKKVGTEYPSACPACGTFLTTVTEAPINKVKVLSRGVTLFDQLNMMETAMLDEAGNPIPLTSYDIVLAVSGEGRDKTMLAMPRRESNAPVEYKEEDKFDLNEAIVKVDADEMLDLKRGVQLKDIFLARRPQEEKTTEAIDNAVSSTYNEVEDSMKELFKN